MKQRKSPNVLYITLTTSRLRGFPNTSEKTLNTYFIIGNASATMCCGRCIKTTRGNLPELDWTPFALRFVPSLPICYSHLPRPARSCLCLSSVVPRKSGYVHPYCLSFIRVPAAIASRVMAEHRGNGGMSEIDPINRVKLNR